MWELRALREVLGGRIRQLLAASKAHGLERRALREVLGGCVRQLPAALKVHGLELRALLRALLREVLGGRVRQLIAALGGRVLSCFFRDLSILAGERTPDRECFVLLK